MVASSASGQDAAAQPPAPAPAAAPAPPPPPPWSVGPIDFSGLIDGYYKFNFNHPLFATNGLSQFQIQSPGIGHQRLIQLQSCRESVQLEYGETDHVSLCRSYRFSG